MAVVSIYSDASYCRATGLAAFAYQIRGNSSPRFGCDEVPGPVTCNNTPELHGVVTALYEGISAGIIAQGDRVMVYTDSQFVIDRLQGGYGKTTPQQDKLIARVAAMVTGFALEVRYTHVKGHSRATGPLTGAMRTCDSLARERLNDLRGFAK